MLKNKLSLVEYVNKVLKSNTFHKSIPEGFLSDIDNKKIKINLEDLEYSFIIDLDNRHRSSIASYYIICIDILCEQ